MVQPRPFVCQCGRGFTRNENLKRHQKSNHSGATARRFACQKCQSKFARRDVCKRHEDKCSYTVGSSLADINSNEPLEQQSNSQDLFNQELIGIENEEQNTISVPAAPQNISPVATVEVNPLAQISQDQVSPTSWRDDQVFLTPQSSDSTDFLADLYFNNFHPALPILHRPTFVISSTPAPLLNVTKAIGLLYLGRSARNTRQQMHESLSQDLWQSAVAEVEQLVHRDQQTFKTLWILQCWILCIIYGTFTGNEENIIKAREMYRYSVDAAREQQLLHQRLALPDDLSWNADLDVTNAPGERLLTQKWMTYIYQESLKLSVYAFYLMDFYLFSAGNLRLNLSSAEFEWDLPWASDLWSAENANDWWSKVSQHGKDILPLTNYIWTDVSYRERDYQTKSILSATQAILSDAPASRLMSILKASSFSTLCVMVNLDCMVRDFTRCYYQLPPNLADPSPFHILSQQQNAQVFTALANVWKIMGDGPCVGCSDDCTSLWHAVRISCLSIKVALSHPDELLIGGIVESNPTAGLITATHLALGNYVIPRRSGLRLQKPNKNEDSLPALLDDLLKAMYEMSVPKSIAWEGPWTFIQGLRLLLVLWRALRVSIAETQNEPDTPTGNYPKLSKHGRMVIDAVSSAAQLYNVADHEASQEDHDPSEDEESDAEAKYIRWMYMVCSKRSAWDSGHAMNEVLDEMNSTNFEDSLRR